MSTLKEQLTGTYLGGFYYTDQITGADNDETLSASKIVGVAADDDLLDTWIYEKTARHMRPKVVLIKGRL